MRLLPPFIVITTIRAMGRGDEAQEVPVEKSAGKVGW